MARLAAERMRHRLGQPAVVEARSGASGHIGAEATSGVVPDGYTTGTVSMHTILINPLPFSGRHPLRPGQSRQLYRRHQEGRVRPLAVTTRERWPAPPAVGAAMAGLSLGSWHLWAGPPGTRSEVIDRLLQAIRAAFAE
ncbi:tripartite tricarboxylate transporter substrate-binding protein [Siccirubricoccus deserti]